MKTKVKAKRSYTNYVLPYKMTPACQAKVALLNKELPYSGPDGSGKSKDGAELYQESNYVFMPGMVPPSRQIFYQVCYIRYTPCLIFLSTSFNSHNIFCSTVMFMYQKFKK